MKIIALLSLLGLSTNVQGWVESDIRDYIQTLVEGESYLDSAALFQEGSYQKKAFDRVATVMSNSDTLNAYINAKGKDSDFDYEEKHVRNYFAAACIYYATNGISNEKTVQFLGADAEIPNWDNDDQWLVNPDYCSWFGVLCHLETNPPETIAAQEAEEEIVELLLFNNTLYGTWPQEVGLLGEKLITIDLFDNFYLHALDYSWFPSMSELQYLFFGTTSWEADGIPSVLNSITSLVQFDCSYTFWSEGDIDGAAFADLDALEYVDMGDNFYTTGQQIPAEMQNLPSLIRLYMDNIIWLNDDRQEVTFTMDFLTNMDNVIEAWFDYTRFSGSLPVLPTSLKSFSVILSGLSGTIDNLVSPDLNIDRAWMSGNEFTGVIPVDIGTYNTDLTRLYLEGNSFEKGNMPQSLCDLRDTAGGNLAELGGDQENCGLDSCCTCVGDACGNLPEPTPAPTPAPASVPISICFSGSSLVEVENVGAVKMSDLSLGDVVKVGANQFEPIYSFGHKSINNSGNFLQVATGQSRDVLEISADHMVTMEGGRKVPASMLKKGDMLVTASDELVGVESIKTVVRKGVFAPFTASGNIVVNDIIASNYIAYQGSEYLTIGGFETPLSYQWIAHTFNSAHRLAVMMGIKGESYTDAGVSQWVDIPNKVFSWVLGQNAIVSTTMISLALSFFSVTRLIEVLALSPLTLVAAIVVTYSLQKKVLNKKSM